MAQQLRQHTQQTNNSGYKAVTILDVVYSKNPLDDVCELEMRNS